MIYKAPTSIKNQGAVYCVKIINTIYIHYGISNPTQLHTSDQKLMIYTKVSSDSENCSYNLLGHPKSDVCNIIIHLHTITPAHQSTYRTTAKPL